MPTKKKLKNFNHEVKCPKCGGDGWKYMEDHRWYFKCVCCGNHTLLKLLNTKQL